MPYLSRSSSSAARGVLAALGELAEGQSPPAVAKWRAEVKARGNVATRMPKGPNVGALAERYVDGAGAYRYALASPDALKADGKVAVAAAQTIAAGARVEQLEKDAKASLALVKQGAAIVLDAPRQAVSGILGIPPWAVTAALLGGVVLVGRAVLPSLGGIASSYAKRRNPPRSRRQPARRRPRRGGR